MNGFFSFLLDIILIGLLSVGIFYAVRLSRNISGLSASREEMERFILEFNSTIERAEAGVRGLKQAARTSGDDLEQLIEKAQSLRDELHFLVESADKIAARLSDTAGAAIKSVATPISSAGETVAKTASVIAAIQPLQEEKEEYIEREVSSAAERHLLETLRKLG